MTVSSLLLGIAAIGMVAIERFRADIRYRAIRCLSALAAVLALGQLLRLPQPAWPAPASMVRQPGMVRELDAPLEVEAGAPLQVRGRLVLAPRDSAWVILADPVGPRDSAQIRGDQPFFTLLDRPRASGTPRYVLQVRDGWTEAAETIGVAVRAPRSPAVLVLDGSPSFETSTLKRWLARQGARITVRTAISRDRFRVENLNGPVTRAEAITGALLRCYDVVIADQGAIAELSDTERRSLRQEIDGAGLGLLLVGAAGPGPTALDDFVMAPTEQGQRISRIAWTGAPQSRIGVETEGRYFLKRAGLEGLAWDDRDRLIAVRRRQGAGWVGSTLVRTPSRWQIEGEAERFGSYWSLLLEAVARDTTLRVTLTGDARRSADQPVELSLWTGGPPPDVAVQAPDGTMDTLPLAGDPFDSSRWTSRYWPRTPGWHALHLPNREVAFLVRPSLPPGATWMTASGPGWSRGFSFLVLVVALTVLWVEARQRGR